MYYKIMAYLLLPDKKQTRKVILNKGVFFVGRARENDLILISDSLSRFHAQITKRGDRFSINDRGSLNGVFINGSRIVGETDLRDGDIIGFGDVHARFCLEEPKPMRETEKVSEKIQRFPVSSLVDSKRFEPEKKQKYLELLYHFSSRLLQHSPSSDFGAVALELIHDVWNPDRSCLMLKGNSGEWQIATQRFGKNPELSNDSFEISRSLVRELEKEQEALLISHRVEDRRFAASESLQRQNVQSVMCAPLWTNKAIHGFLYCDLIRPERSFSYSDLEMFTILTNLMAMKWENDQLWQQALIQQQLEQELNVAAEIQRKFFPVQTPDISGYESGALTIPSRKVGGDAYFWHERRNGEVVFMIADVMGKGLPSSLLMSQIQAIMKIFAEQYKEARDIVTAVNEFIYRHSTQEKFISMVTVVLNPKEGEMSYCNAGHNAPCLLNSGAEPFYLETGGMLLGVFEDQVYSQGSARIEKGGTLVFYTDGVTEARNKEDIEYGVERLVEFVRENDDIPARILPEAIISNIRENWLGTDQEDDWTLLIVKRALHAHEPTR
ncbi:SpoIIE family protein phosphatase [bacterium]|nr:SpoIIE family protein phosphatase [bacterium]